MRSILMIPAPFAQRGRLLPFIPYGLLSLQAVSKGLAMDVAIMALPEIFSGREFQDTDDLALSIAGLVDGDQHDAVGFSTTCGSFHYSLVAAAEIKRRYPAIEVWMGGPHVSVAPGRVLGRYAHIDALFIGEAEETFRELLSNSVRASAAAKDVAGIHTRETAFRSREPLADLDGLPFIDQADDYLPSFEFESGVMPPSVPLEVARGCPGRCTFCSTRLYWGNHVRWKSSARIIAEMDRLHALTGEHHFSFIGDNLAFPRERLVGLCHRLRDEGRGYTWVGGLKLDDLQAADLDLLWDAGCRGLFVGVESGSQETLDRARKGVDLQRLRPLLFQAIEKGFLLDASFMVGFPWETSSDLRKTYGLHAELLKSGAYRSKIAMVCPLPGTDLHHSYAGRLRPGRRDSQVVYDELPFGDKTLDVIGHCPELFSQFGCLPTENVDQTEVRATVQAAAWLASVHRHDGSGQTAARPSSAFPSGEKAVAPRESPHLHDVAPLGDQWEKGSVFGLERRAPRDNE